MSSKKKSVFGIKLKCWISNRYHLYLRPPDKNELTFLRYIDICVRILPILEPNIYIRVPIYIFPSIPPILFLVPCFFFFYLVVNIWIYLWPSFQLFFLFVGTLLLYGSNLHVLIAHIIFFCRYILVKFLSNKHKCTKTKTLEQIHKRIVIVNESTSDLYLHIQVAIF